MSRQDETLLEVGLTFLFCIACCLGLAYLYSERMDECMAEHNDKVLCTIYAESLFK